MTLRMSVAITVRNDRANMEPLLAQLAAQTRAPDELVIVDACSTDGTWELSQEFSRSAPFPVIAHQEGGSRGIGRTRCVELASGDVVAFIDSDCEISDDWLARYEKAWHEEAVKDERPLGALGGANHTPPGSSELQQAIDDVMGPMEVDSFHGINTINCVYLRDAALAAGAFDTHLHTAEDPDLNARIAKLGHRLARIDNPCWHKRRDTWRKLIRQHYEYGKGAAVLLARHPEYFPRIERWIPQMGLVAVAALLALSLVLHPAIAWLAPLGVAAFPLAVHRRHAWRFLRTHGASLATLRRWTVLWVVYVPYQLGAFVGKFGQRG